MKYPLPVLKYTLDGLKLYTTGVSEGECNF
jgi:hypothetical protein